jgi:MFS family permease
MMPAFADAVYQRGSAGLAILTSAIGAGAIATGLVLSRGTTWLNVNVVRTAAGSGGILTAALGLPLHFNVAVAIVTSIGIVLSICGVGSQILIQTLVDDGVRGRVSSIWGMVAFGGTAIGGLLVGSAASLWGLQNSVMVAGILCSVAVALSAKLAKQSVALD